MNLDHHPLHEREDPHHQGLAQDLIALGRQRAQARRGALRWVLAAGAAALVGCGGSGGDSSVATSDDSTDDSSGGTDSGSTDTGSCAVIPEETAGPYPGDGSNTSGGSLANALSLSGIVREDIRQSVDTASGVAEGVPLTVVIELVNTNDSCASLEGYAVYLWHCDAAGRYSMYSSGVTDENYLRGVQVSDADGRLSFTTIFPGCYSGRMPHMHFEVYRSATAATSYSNRLHTSQIAFPEDTCRTVYSSSSLYSASVGNLAAISFSTDNVFSDGVDTQLATVSGDTSSGYTATLQVGIAV